MRDRLYIGALGLLPKAAWSRAIGAAAHAPLPRPICQAAIRAFAKAYDINVDDAELPLDAYRTVGEFFTRRLKAGARPVDRRPGFAVAPCDGKVLNSGRISNGTLIQAKGRRFSLNELLQSNTEAAQIWDLLDRGPIHRPKVARNVPRGRDLALNGVMDPMIVLGAQVD